MWGGGVVVPYGSYGFWASHEVATAVVVAGTIAAIVVPAVVATKEGRKARKRDTTIHYEYPPAELDNGAV
jgi:hypothetical protein